MPAKIRATSEFTPLSTAKARALTDEIRQDFQSLWSKVREAHDRGAHQAMGYTSWEAYCRAEFEIGRSQAYRLIDAARVVDALSSPMEDTGIPNERVAREFGPLMDNPDALRAAHQEATKRAPRDAEGRPKLTAKAVRRVVQNYTRKNARPSAGGANGDALRPGGDVDDELEIPTLNAAVATLKRSVARDLDDLDHALEILKRSAGSGLYRPGNDVQAAIQDLIELIASLIKLSRAQQS